MSEDATIKELRDQVQHALNLAADRENDFLEMRAAYLNEKGDHHELQAKFKLVRAAHDRLVRENVELKEQLEGLPETVPHQIRMGGLSFTVHLPPGVAVDIEGDDEE